MGDCPWQDLYKPQTKLYKMAAASGTDAVTHVDDTTPGDEGIADGAEEVGERVSLLISSFNLSKSPILERMDAVLIRAGDSLLHVLEHRETLRRFEIRVTNDDLAPLGFNPRDTLEDCFEILKDAYEKGGTQTRMRRTLSVATVNIAQMRTDDAVFGEPMFAAATAAADDPTDDKEPDTETISFEECDALKVEVTEDIGRRLPLRYVLLLTECQRDEGIEDKRTISGLKARVKQLEMEVELLRSALTVTLETVGFGKSDYVIKCWSGGEFAPVLRMWRMKSTDECKLFSLCEDRCTMLFRVHGYYRFEMDAGTYEESLHVNSRKVYTYKKSNVVFSERLKAGDKVFTKPTGHTFWKGASLKVTKL